MTAALRLVTATAIVTGHSNVGDAIVVAHVVGFGASLVLTAVRARHFHGAAVDAGTTVAVRIAVEAGTDVGTVVTAVAVALERAAAAVAVAGSVVTTLGVAAGVRLANDGDTTALGVIAGAVVAVGTVVIDETACGVATAVPAIPTVSVGVNDATTATDGAPCVAVGTTVTISPAAVATGLAIASVHATPTAPTSARDMRDRVKLLIVAMAVIPSRSAVQVPRP